MSVTKAEALEAVKSGADIYSHALALKLREIEQEEPELIWICKARHAPVDGAVQQPYFGCICTKAGRQELARLQSEEVHS